MKNEDFIIQFDILYNNISSNKAPGLNIYEKSFFLTLAQDQLVQSYYNGTNISGYTFESKEEVRRALDALVRTKIYKSDELNDTSDEVLEDQENEKIIPVDSSSKFVKLPSETWYVTFEQVKFDDEALGCANGSTAIVQPITQDEYSRVKTNPFRGPTKYRVLRLDCGSNYVELISKYNIGEYTVRYVQEPYPIILDNLPNNLKIKGVSRKTECQLNKNIHNLILDLAVKLAYAAWSKS